MPGLKSGAIFSSMRDGADSTVGDKMVLKPRLTLLDVTILARLIVDGKDDRLPLPADMPGLLKIARNRSLFD